MKVKLTDDGFPAVVGERIDGQDIPAPPDPKHHHRWDGENWVMDVRRGRQTKADIRSRLKNNQISVREALLEILK
jgi:hypothetical protein